MIRIIYTRRAEDELRAIWRYIAESARLLIEGRFLILYETHPDVDEGPIEAIEIVSVDGRRDLTELF